MRNSGTERVDLFMTETTETKREREERPRQPARRPWHAPAFISTDLASTYTQGNGGYDGGPMGSQS